MTFKGKVVLITGATRGSLRLRISLAKKALLSSAGTTLAGVAQLAARTLKQQALKEKPFG